MYAILPLLANYNSTPIESIVHTAIEEYFPVIGCELTTFSVVRVNDTC